MRQKSPQLETDVGRFATTLAKSQLPASLVQFAEELDWNPSYAKKILGIYKRRVWAAIEDARAKYNGASPEEGFNSAAKDIMERHWVPILTQYIPKIGWAITGPTTSAEYERFLKIQSGSLRFAKSLAINRLKKLKLYGYPMPFNLEKALASEEEQRKLLG